jgi:hypothetical protein
MAISWTLVDKIAANMGRLTRLQQGTGVAGFGLYSASNVLLATFAVDTAASSVVTDTGDLVLANASGAVGVAAGVAVTAKLQARDGGVLVDAIPVAQGVVAVAQMLVVDSTTITVSGPLTLVSAYIVAYP